jgi:ferredoxin-NADP reductase
MRNTIWITLTAASFLAATAGRTQSAADHLQHHPDNQTALPNTATPATPSKTAASNPRAAPAMGGMHAEGEHQAYRQPLYPKLLALPANDARGRAALLAQARHSMTSAAAEIRMATAKLSSATDRPGLRSQALDQLRTATAEYQSAAAVISALQSGSHSQATALNWFRDAMNLDAVPHTEDQRFLGLGAMHVLAMTAGALLAAALLLLQFQRVKRARTLLLGFKPTSAIAEHGASSPTEISPRGQAKPEKPVRRWSGQLRVAHIADETPTVETYRLVPIDGDELPFDFAPGQFLQVEVAPEEGKPFRRSYTIASSPTQRAFVELTVKREDHGVVSRFLNEKLAVGDLLSVSGPFGSFTFSGTDADSIVLIAGGVGITPMMSVLRYLTDKAWPGEIFLLYGARSTEEFLFREEIERLERRHPNLHVLASMQRTPGTVWLGPEGNLTKELIALAVPQIGQRRIHLCGPPGMMTAVRSSLLELGVAEAQIYTEAFGPASLPNENAPQAVTAPTAKGPVQPMPAVAANQEVAETTITFAVSGTSAALHSDQTILEAAEGAGVEIPFSCRVGTCGVCVTKLLSGEVSMAVETGLDPADKAQGYVLACQAKCTSGPIVVEA